MASFTPLGYDNLNAQTFIAHPAEIKTESGLPHCISGKTPNGISGKKFRPGKKANQITDMFLHTLHFHALIRGKVLPPQQNYEPNRRQGFAYPAFLCPDSGEYFATPAKMQTESQARFFDY